MSEGEICKSRVWLSLHGSTALGEWRQCGHYVGHDGKHETSLKCVVVREAGGKEYYSATAIGSISWDDTLANKQPKTIKFG